jgi:hypothetical protein
MIEKLTKKELVLFTFLIFFACVAWISILDKAAYSMNLDALKETTSAFVLLKSIDALISVFNNIPVVGAILTPYNDFLDKMSFVMLISLMSLGLQKVMIVSFQSFFVNAILSFSVLFIVANKFMNLVSSEWAEKILKFTFIVLFIRFAIPLMTFSIVSIEIGTKQMQAEISQERIIKLQEKISNINEMIMNKENAEKEKEIKINALKNKIELLNKEKDEIKIEIKSIKNGDKTILERASTFFDELSQKDKEQIENKENRIEAIKGEISMIKNEISDSDSFFDFTGLKSKIKIASANINSYMSEMFDIFITMVVLFFFKNVFFPILFIWGLAKFIDSAFNTGYENKLKQFRDEKVLV